MNSEARIYAKWAMTYAAALALVGCEGSASDNIEQPMPAAATASIQLPDPCKLFSDQELIAEFGSKPDGWKILKKQFTPFPDIGGGKCEIDAEYAEGGRRSFEISVMSALKGSILLGLAKSKRTPIPDVGEQAFHMDRGYYAYANGVIIGIRLLSASSESHIKLLRSAVSRV